MLYFHVGLQKTGTSFLQQEVFPKWKGISYIGADLEVLLRMDPEKTYLVSREGLSGQNWAHHDVREKSLERLSGLFPDARLIISFRRHSGYIVSSYRQYLLRGGTLAFDEYFDLSKDEGFMKQDDYYFRKKICAIERFFHHTPFVFLHEELRDGMDDLLSDLERYVGGRAPSRDEIAMRRVNTGVNYYPAKLLRRLNALTISELNPGGRYNLNHPLLQTLRLTPRAICKHWLAFLPSPRFLPDSQTAAIDEFYKDDWEFVRSYATSRRERAGRRPA